MLYKSTPDNPRVEMTEQEMQEFLACLTTEEQWIKQKTDGIRQQRNSLLSQSDWTQNADIPESVKILWQPYRQALRDIPQQEGFPENIIWPVAPGA